MKKRILGLIVLLSIFSINISAKEIECKATKYSSVYSCGDDLKIILGKNENKLFLIEGKSLEVIIEEIITGESNFRSLTSTKEL